jgi:hypothetical protein
MNTAPSLHIIPMGQSYSAPVIIPDNFLRVHAFVTEHIIPVLVANKIPQCPPELHDATVVITPRTYTVIFYSACHEDWTVVSKCLDLFQSIHNAYVFHHDYRHRNNRCTVCFRAHHSAEFQGCEACLPKKNWPYTRYMLLRELLGRDAALYTAGILCR